MAKKGGSGFVKNTVSKSLSQGPIIRPGSGVSGSTIPRAGHPPGGVTSATRYDKNVDSHSVDHKNR